jgi:hypothetical protein
MSDDDVRWMTYLELAHALKIGVESARNLVRRKRWPRQAGNDGLARIGAPMQYLLEHAKPDAPDEGALEPAANPVSDIQGAIAALERHIERLERELAVTVTERDAERVRAAQIAVLEAVLVVERQRLTAALEDAKQWREVAMRPRGFWAWLKRAASNEQAIPTMAPYGRNSLVVGVRVAETSRSIAAAPRDRSAHTNVGSTSRSGVPASGIAAHHHEPRSLPS